MSLPTSHPEKALKRRDSNVMAAIKNPAWSNQLVNRVLGWSGEFTRQVRRSIRRVTPPQGSIKINACDYL